jgi:periplasmic protein TonB
MAAGLDDMPGIMEATHVSGTAQGPGTGGGAGDGRGPGSGNSMGAGAGPGTDQGIDGGPFGGGSDVTRPQLVREVRPNYTAEAMRARVQGAVLLDCVVLPDGTVGDIRILKSLDRAFGLDEQAVEAARQWRFVPATRRGRPVSVRITIEIAFTLR